MARDSMLMYRSFYESIAELPAEQYKHLMTSIAAYSLDRIEPELIGMEKALFILIRPQLDANDNRYQNSLKGGRKKQQESNDNHNNGKEDINEDNGNQEYTKEEPKENQTETDSETNVSVSLNDSVSVSENENGNSNSQDKPGFSKAEALNPNTQNSEQRFQQLKTAWNTNCKPACNIKSTITMNYAQRDDWTAGESQIVDIFATCKAIQNYGGIQSSAEYELDNHSGYSMLSFLVKGVEWYTDEADPWSRCRKKPAAKQVERDLVPTEPNPFDAKDPFGGE